MDHVRSDPPRKTSEQPIARAKRVASRLPGLSVLELQRGAGNRAMARFISAGAPAVSGARLARQDRPEIVIDPPGPPRLSPEVEFAQRNGGQVQSVGSSFDKETDVDEFILWNFLVNSADVRRGHRAKLDPVARRWATELRADPRLRLHVGGFASRSGSDPFNDELTLKRAEAVKKYLVESGVPERQIVVDSSGRRFPLAPGKSPSDLARNRRVEITKFVETKVVGSLGPDIAVTAGDIDMTFRPELVEDSERHFFAARMRSTIGTADVNVTSKDPSVEVGFVQFLTEDLRQALYVDAKGRIAGLDWGHCMGAFTPCRDLEFARLPFSFENQQGRPTAVARPRASATKIEVRDAPGIVFPWSIRVPGRGQAQLRDGAWKMVFAIVLIARRGAEVVPLKHVIWQLTATMTFPTPGAGPARTKPDTREVSRGNGAPPGLDIERAMSLPTCRLRARSMATDPGTSLTPSARDGVCRPRLIVAS